MNSSGPAGGNGHAHHRSCWKCEVPPPRGCRIGPGGSASPRRPSLMTVWPSASCKLMWKYCRSISRSANAVLRACPSANGGPRLPAVGRDGLLDRARIGHAYGSGGRRCVLANYAVDLVGYMREVRSQRMPKSLDLALCGVRSHGQIRNKREERIRLADEETHRGKKLERSHGCPRRVRRPDYRTCREAGADEWARFRHDQVGLEHFPDCGACCSVVGVYARVEVGEVQTIGRVGDRRRKASLFRPGLE